MKSKENSGIILLGMGVNMENDNNDGFTGFHDSMFVDEGPQEEEKEENNA